MEQAEFLNRLNKLTQEVLSCAPVIIQPVFFCKVKSFPMLEELHPKIIPYYITE
jgi:hypothetical protein